MAKTLDELMEYYFGNTADCGGAGRAFETAVRSYIIHKVERVHPMTIADIHAKRNGKRSLNLECKSGCGWLIHPTMDTKEEAEEKMANSLFLLKSDYICYTPKFTGDISTARVMTQYAFLKILSENNLIRVKSDKGYWGISIQSYIPTPKFKASPTRYAKVMDEFQNHSVSIDEWMTKMGLV